MEYSDANVIINDALDEDDETFTLEIYDFENARAGVKTRSTITIQDDDEPPTLSVADAEATEGGGVEFTVSLSAVSGRDVTVDWATSTESFDTAAAGDFTAVPATTLTFMPGDTAKTVTVQTTQDTDDEENETFTLTLSNPSNATLGTDPTARGTIVDDDASALPTLSVANASGAESDGVTFTVTLSAAATAEVTVDWTASIESGNTATAADLGSTTTATVTIAVNETTGMFTVPVALDTTDEDTQSFTVTLSNPSNATLAADPTATGRIEDDDAPPILSVEDQTVIEGDQDPDGLSGEEGGAPFRVTLSAASEKTVWYRVRRVAVAGDTASDADLASPYDDYSEGISRGNTVDYYALGYIKDDALDEPDETFTVEIHGLENATLAGDATTVRVTITIQDDDETPSVTVADTMATEGDKAAFTVTLSAVSGREVTVDWATSVGTGDTATSDTDFTAASGTLTIAKDNPTGPVEVETLTDTTNESDETFTVTLSNPSNATLGAEITATGTIENRAVLAPTAPADFMVAVGNAQVVLSWDPPASDSGITSHEFRYKTTGSYPAIWTPIANSGVGGANQAGFTVPMLTNEVAHTFQLRAVNDGGNGATEEADPVTPTPGICDRTEKIQEVILAEISGVSDCAAVTAMQLAAITSFGGSLGFGTFSQGITSLQAGDFAGLTSLTLLNLNLNQLTSLPEGIFDGLAELTQITVETNQLASLPEGAFAGLVKLEYIDLGYNRLTGLPAGVFAGLPALSEISLSNNALSSLPAGIFSGLTALETLNLPNTGLSSLPAGVFFGTCQRL